MDFIKCEALGNEFIVLINTPLPSSELTVKLCNPVSGPGGDGIIHLASKKADSSLWHTTVINCDGTNGDFSGNGLRCGALCLGTKNVKFVIANQIIEASVTKGKVSLSLSNDYSASKRDLTDSMKAIDFEKLLGITRTSLSYLHIGNPHLIIDTCGEKVIITESVKDKINELRQRETLVADGINVTIMTDSPGTSTNMRLTTFERGVGLTPGCGSAALAAFITIKNENKTIKAAKFTSQGGIIELSERDNKIVMTGNVKKIFDGTYDMVDNEYGKR